MLTKWARLNSIAEAQELLRILEDAHYLSYDNGFDSSHNGIYSGRFKIISLWDDNSYVGHSKEDKDDLLEPIKEMSFTEFKAMLIYEAGS